LSHQQKDRFIRDMLAGEEPHLDVLQRVPPPTAGTVLLIPRQHPGHPCPRIHHRDQSGVGVGGDAGWCLTNEHMSDSVTDMKVNSREFQRDFARMKAKAAAGETVHIISDGEQFIFQAVKPKTWQGALKGKAKITGDLFSTGLAWETSK
jgi:hypothetical protein